MTYESAPATRLVATACCCCGRPLVDSVSVEAGVGPKCREKYGYGEAQGPVDAKAFDTAMGFPQTRAREPRGLANELTHRIAVNRAAKDASRYVAAIDALGYHKLAATLAERVIDSLIEVTEERDTIIVRTPFSEGLVAAMADIPGRRWDAARKVTTFPTSSAAALVGALRRRLPPTTLIRGRNGRLRLLGGNR